MGLEKGNHSEKQTDTNSEIFLSLRKEIEKREEVRGRRERNGKANLGQDA